MTCFYIHLMKPSVYLRNSKLILIWQSLLYISEALYSVQYLPEKISFLEKLSTFHSALSMLLCFWRHNLSEGQFYFVNVGLQSFVILKLFFIWNVISSTFWPLFRCFFYYISIDFGSMYITVEYCVKILPSPWFTPLLCWCYTLNSVSLIYWYSKKFNLYSVNKRS